MSVAFPTPTAAPGPDASAMTPLQVTLVCAAMVALGPLAMVLYTPAMPTIAADLGVSGPAVKMTLTSYFAGFALAQLVAGPLSDALGRRATLFWFIGLFLAATVWAIMAQDIEHLIAARAVQGVGASVGVAVSRAVVRDRYVGEASSKIMNAIGMTLAIGPAVAPVIGGLTLQILPWNAVFGLMLLYGLLVLGMVYFMLRETVVRDMRRFRPASLALAYGQLLRSRAFVSTSLMLGGSIGTMYASATLLPFVLIDEVGLSPAEFGAAMIVQTGCFFFGSLTVRQLLRRHGARKLAAPGLGFIVAGAAMLVPHAFGLAPTLINTMGPIGVYAFGIAFVMPFASTSGLAPFPHIAGAAAALMGFAQMGGGLIGGLVGASVGDPSVGLGIVVPMLAITAAGSYAFWRRLPASETGEPEARAAA
ncbi:MAG: DHA1 family bicyclomycin/chloramphenicol resistance-like MFS transporter [Paracoccaceae bacterium]|jgi:DHA1 family bicyclomycin/chloramphenicol resistance-like MFS transporter